MKSILDMLQKHYAGKSVTVGYDTEEDRGEFVFVGLVRGVCEIYYADTLDSVEAIMIELKNCDKKK